MSTTIFALAICIFTSDPAWAKANGCRFPENGMVYFQTAGECQRVADHTNKVSDAVPLAQRATTKRTIVCYKRSTDADWEPTSLVEVEPDPFANVKPSNYYGVKDEASCRPLVVKGFEEYAQRIGKVFTTQQRDTLIQLRLEVCMRDGFSRYLQ
jgi:hypothetical protein